MAIKELYEKLSIPPEIRQTRIPPGAVSDDLSALLRRRRIRLFGGLASLTPTDFQRTNLRAAALYAEARTLIVQARLLSQSSSRVLEPASAPPLEPNSIEQRGPFDTGPKPGRERIYVPAAARGKSLAAFPISARLQHLFGNFNFRLLNDLHWRTYASFKEYRGCGKKCLAELRSLIQSVPRNFPASEAGHGDQNQENSIPIIPPGTVFVPLHIRNTELSDLPASARLQSVFSQLNARQLGDLHGLPIARLTGLGNCGKKTIRNLTVLLEQTGQGHFKSDPNPAWDPARMIQFLDQLLDILPHRNQRILIRRWVGDAGRLPSFRAIGPEFGLSRTRILQVIRMDLTLIRQRGGRRLQAYLAHIKALCKKSACPLTPALLQTWLGPLAAAARFNMTFYCRLLAGLEPNLPVRLDPKASAATDQLP